jgi:hypothetical protein
MAGVNRLIGGALVLQGKRHFRPPCKDHDFLKEYCLESEKVEKPTSAKSYGINPVFSPSSVLANKKLLPDILKLFSKAQGDLNDNGPCCLCLMIVIVVIIVVIICICICICICSSYFNPYLF